MTTLTVEYDAGSINYVSLRGCLVHKTCMDFVNHLKMDALHDSLILNISELEQLDGSGVGVLVTLAICLRRQRKYLVLLAPRSKQPGSMLHHLGLTKLLGVQ